MLCSYEYWTVESSHARNFRLYRYILAVYILTFLFKFVSEHCLRSTLHLHTTILIDTLINYIKCHMNNIPMERIRGLIILTCRQWLNYKRCRSPWSNRKASTTSYGSSLRSTFIFYRGWKTGEPGVKPLNGRTGETN